MPSHTSDAALSDATLATGRAKCITLPSSRAIASKETAAAAAAPKGPKGDPSPNPSPNARRKLHPKLQYVKLSLHQLGTPRNLRTWNPKTKNQREMMRAWVLLFHMAQNS